MTGTTIVLASAGAPPFLAPVAALVVAAGLIGYASIRLRIVPIVGFLVAGVLIGPEALALVREREVLDAAGEVGVILLLFTIGIEFSLGKLGRIRKLVLLGGGTQVLTAVGLVTGILVLAGVEWRVAVFTGFLVAVSSTAIVLKLMGDRGETGSTTGQAALGFLIFQDLAVVVMVLLLPILGGGDGGGLDLVVALGTALAVIVVTLLVARRVMPRILEAVARACSPEVFLLTVIALCLGTAYLTALAGVSVSLGAFLAGLVVSESRHSEHAMGEILPLQILFSAVFFLSVGTLLDVRFLVREPLLVLGAVGLVVGVKLLTTAIAARLVGIALPTAGALALLLVQVGEFSFVLEKAGRGEGLSPAGLGEDGSQAFIAATVLLMVATPSLAGLGRRLQERGRRRERARQAASNGSDHGRTVQRDHVLISGWGPGARHLAADLCARGLGITVITLSPDGAAEAEALGHEVVRGDSTKAHILGAAGIDRAGVVVIADDAPEMAARIAGVVSSLAPAVPLVVRSLEDVDLADLLEVGVDAVVTGERASRGALVTAVTRRLGEAAEPGVDTSTVVHFRPRTPCAHVDDDTVRAVLPSDAGCTGCLRTGQSWVHLRMCAGCGEVGCCDSSPGQHASAHAHAQSHPVMVSVEPGEGWGWCYLDSTRLEAAAPEAHAPAGG